MSERASVQHTSGPASSFVFLYGRRQRFAQTEGATRKANRKTRKNPASLSRRTHFLAGDARIVCAEKLTLLTPRRLTQSSLSGGETRKRRRSARAVHSLCAQTRAPDSYLLLPPPPVLLRWFFSPSRFLESGPKGVEAVTASSASFNEIFGREPRRNCPTLCRRETHTKTSRGAADDLLPPRKRGMMSLPESKQKRARILARTQPHMAERKSLMNFLSICLLSGGRLRGGMGSQKSRQKCFGSSLGVCV